MAGTSEPFWRYPRAHKQGNLRARGRYVSMSSLRSRPPI